MRGYSDFDWETIPVASEAEFFRRCKEVPYASICLCGAFSGALGSGWAKIGRNVRGPDYWGIRTQVLQCDALEGMYPPARESHPLEGVDCEVDIPPPAPPQVGVSAEMQELIRSCISLREQYLRVVFSAASAAWRLAEQDLRIARIRGEALRIDAYRPTMWGNKSAVSNPSPSKGVPTIIMEKGVPYGFVGGSCGPQRYANGIDKMTPVALPGEWSSRPLWAGGSEEYLPGEARYREICVPERYGGLYRQYSAAYLAAEKAKKEFPEYTGNFHRMICSKWEGTPLAANESVVFSGGAFRRAVHTLERAKGVYLGL